MPRFAAAALVLISAAAVFAQKQNPVQWTVAADPQSVAPGKDLLLKVQARIDPGWHIYSLSTPEGGPTPTTVKLEPNPLFSSTATFQPIPVTKFDKNFQINTEILEAEKSFLIRAGVAPDAKTGPAEAVVQVRYQACTDTECLPRKATLKAAFAIDPGASGNSAALPAGYKPFTGARSVSVSPTSASAAEAQSLPAFLAIAFGFGLAAIFTPCVFPMIPITLSVFLNRQGVTRAQGLANAGLFCLGIIVLFTALGLVVTAVLGPFGVVQLGSNPWVNGFIALVFLVFGLSLLGAFEITLPSGLLTRVDRASQSGGIVGTLLMGLTFSLTSFACVGPFVGPLLASSVQLGGIQPALGMMAFSAGLSAPFFLLAAFPAFLQRLPKSGGWLARVKVTLGFIVLAAMLKYLSSIDQVLQLNILTRERFIAAWFVLFALAGLYLIGLLRLEGVREGETIGSSRLLAGAALLAFAFSLLPGMFGGRLGELDSFVPAPAEGIVQSAGGTAASLRATWMKNDFEGAAAKAKAEGKLLLVSFTGYACTNCHWMKANMFTRPEIHQELDRFILVELYTDGTDAVSERNQQLQESRFGTVSIPFYAVMAPDGRVVKTFAGLTRNVGDYRSFLATPAVATAAL